MSAVMDGVVRVERSGRQTIGDAEFDGLVKLRPPGERYFGCGERTAGLEKTGTRQVFWNVDPPEGHTASFSNLYTSIPFVLCLREGRAHGVFYDHPGRVELDLAKTDPSRVTVSAGDDLSVHVLSGPTPADVLERYTALTGRMPMPPLWALGNQQSRWSYMDADEVRTVASEWMSMPQLQNLGLSGIAWCGVDVGGFFDDCNGELLARWTEFGAFQPFCRNHSAMGTARQEPWAFGEPWESVCRAMLELRMQLLPYLYTAFEECHRTGAPVLRPLLFSYPDDPVTYTADDEFLFGSSLLIAPISRPGIEHRHVYLPAGSWAHWWTHTRIEGPAHVLAHAPLGQPAVYARCDTPIPMWPVLQHTDEVPDFLTWRVFAGGGSGSGSLYEDRVTAMGRGVDELRM